MHIDINTPLDELFELWVKYSHQIWNTKAMTKELLGMRMEADYILSKKGISLIQILSMDKEAYTLTYRQYGCTNTKRILIAE